MLKTKTVFICQTCGYQVPKWMGRCPDCNSWSSFVEENISAISVKDKTSPDFLKDQPVLLQEVEALEESRLKTQIQELDQVLGGGIVPGSVILIGGSPGIGKSTLSLQLSDKLSVEGHKVLYVSGEESIKQTKLRADRLGKTGDKLYIVNQTNISWIMEYIDKISPEVVIIDSIQVVYQDSLSSSPGGVSQIRECAGILTRFAKSKGISIFLIGHVTKEGYLAGPRVLEHIVDTVLYFEGEHFSQYRILRATKNRFGSTNEIGVFEMSSEGLKEVNNPSEYFLSERPKHTSGSVIVCVLEGTRPVLVEVQALVTKSNFGLARRRSQGIDYNRFLLLVAVLEKRIGLQLFDKDIFVNVIGGMKLEDPACDLGMLLAIASSYKEKEICSDVVVCGEVGLASEVRSITQASIRIKEAQKLGFNAFILPKGNLKGTKDIKDIKLIGVETVKEAIDKVLI
ncbi:MAG: DNA repair protein RadA [Candidatus Omnitrophota bacterium]